MKKNIHKHRATYAYIIATLIFSAILYFLLVSTTNNLRENCQTINQERAETQASNISTQSVVDVLNDYMIARLNSDRSKIAESVPVVKNTIKTLEDFEIETEIELVLCKEQFPMPFPLNLTE